MHVYSLMFICLGKISKPKIQFEPNLKGVQTRAGQPHYSETAGQSSRSVGPADCKASTASPIYTQRETPESPKHKKDIVLHVGTKFSTT